MSKPSTDVRSAVRHTEVTDNTWKRKFTVVTRRKGKRHMFTLRVYEANPRILSPGRKSFTAFTEKALIRLIKDNCPWFKEPKLWNKGGERLS